MPTAVSTAKQYLSPEASHALEEAVSLTRRHGHSQTTSLHAMSALMSLTPSLLREACIRAQNAAFHPRIQLNALDFCLTVSLDRLPVSHPRVDQPTISNSLMAAIKRSQANQRRQPDHTDNNCIMTVKNPTPLVSNGQYQLGPPPPSSCIKVELQNLIVSILDDPIVSRVFQDAGFRSFDVKMALLRPFSNFFTQSSGLRGYQGVYLNSFSGHLDPGYRPFRFPFAGGRGMPKADEEYKRIGEVLVRKQGRNPLLVGCGATDTLRGFVEILERDKERSFLPIELRGISVVCIENDLLKCVRENWSEEVINTRFTGLDLMAQHCLCPGLMISVGDLSSLLVSEDGFGRDPLNLLVRKLTNLIEVHGKRMWFIGSTVSDQTYLEFLREFPSIDKEWDLQPLPITTVTNSIGEYCFKSSMSFVPLGGFFSSLSDMRFPFSSSCQYDKHDAAVSAFPKQTPLSPWMQMAKHEANINALEKMEAKGDTMLGVQKKWDNASQHLDPDKSSYVEIHQDHVNNSNIPNHLEGGPSNPIHLRSLKDENFLDKLGKVPLKTENSFTNLDDDQTSPSSVVTDLGLELLSQPCKQLRKANDGWVKFRGNYDVSNFKSLFNVLFERIGRQSEALRIVSQTVSHAWARKQTIRGDVWLNFIGSDVFGQRKIGLALAEVLYGDKNKFIHVDLSSEEELFQHTSDCSLQIYSSDVRFRGKTIVDHIIEKLREKPFCVVFLENVHFADPMVQHSLSQAIRNGRFSDSYGREIITNNKIFILSSTDTKNNFHEERLVKSKCYPLQIMVRDIRTHSSNQLSTRTTNAENFPYQIILNKRKLDGKVKIIEQNVNVSQQVKRSNQRWNMSLDLNLPVGLAEDTESWLQGLSDHARKALVKVEFDSFDYDGQAEKILKWVNESFNKVGLGCSLEIEPTVVDQILTASCMSNDDKNIQDWVNHVLIRGFTEAQKRYQLNTDTILILATCSNVSVEEHIEGCLPSKIILM